MVVHLICKIPLHNWLSIHRYRALIPFYQHLPFPAVRKFKENSNLAKSVVNDIIDAKRKQLKIGRGLNFELDT